MDPLSVGCFVLMAVVTVVLVIETRSLRNEVSALNGLISEIAAKAAAFDAIESRVLALEIENRTIKAETDEIRAAGRRAELDKARSARPASFRAFRNQIKGTEIEQ